MAGIPLGLINGVSPQPGGIKAGNDDQDAAAVAVEPYNMHVSAKYLELTKRKLELTRLPHELEELPEDRKWNYGPPKAVLEPLVDYWLCDYSWRTEESHYNTALPQYRTAITIPSGNSSETLRIHFVHKRYSSRPSVDGDVTPQPQPRARRKAVRVVPLLFCHDVQASSFLDVSSVLDALTSAGGGGPGGGGGGSGEDDDIAFDVVAPSVPGTGFSDASGAEGFGAGETADVFDALMKRLGYGRYVAFGAGWGFAVCRALALRHGPDSCVAIHTANPASFFPPPSLQKTPLEWMRYQWARVTGARVPGLSFGYAPADFDGGAQKSGIKSGKTKLTDEENAVQEVLTNDDDSGNETEGTVCLSSRPQTLAYALCDSPVGLLAHTLDLLKPCLALGRAGYLSTVWTPAILLSWTMLQWLPGPEAGFWWMQRAKSEIKAGGLLWRRHSEVPLGISQFGKPHGVLRWAQAWQEVRWLKKREASDVIRPEWESPEELAQDLRESFGSVWSEA